MYNRVLDESGECDQETVKKDLYILAAGGTGGHLFPAVSLACVLKSRGKSVILFTDERAEKWVDHACFDRIVVSRFRPNANASQKIKKIIFIKGLVWCGIKSFLFLLWRRPAAVVGFGGYPSAPTVFAAQILGIPSILHECNAILGKANEILAKRAKAITTGFKNVVKLPLQRNHVFTGNPVREKISQLAYTKYELPKDGVNIFIVGGSQGAGLFSRVVPEAIKCLSKECNRYNVRVIMQVSDTDRERVGLLYKQAGVDATLAPFFQNMDEILRWAHIVISRSGALSLAEIAAAGVPSVLVPLASSRDGDQLYNAAQYEQAGASVLIEEHAFTPETLTALLLELCSDHVALQEMSKAAREMFVAGAAERLGAVVCGEKR
ncbi:MAG: undecaprenyldiphospho-muramoylpentapeptide beta-N-acetylglucosaminyltransferase [Holosporales bacterium]|nr:undecaprenyldiphospho-muramoylpentapeptide beta-N-acetylglucosaminyltransferase [Holosporales bacterium]